MKNIYVIKYTFPSGKTMLSGSISGTLSEAAHYGDSMVDEWNDGTTYTIIEYIPVDNSEKV